MFTKRTGIRIAAWIMVLMMLVMTAHTAGADELVGNALTENEVTNPAGNSENTVENTDETQEGLFTELVSGTQGDFAWEELNGTYAKITQYLGSDTTVEIPDHVSDFIVQEIGDNAFSGNETISSVKIPDTVKRIDGYAFAECTSLKDVVFGNGLETIKNSAFFGCSAIESLIFPQSMREIGSYAFEDCTALSNPNFREGLLSIGDHAFKNCTGLTKVTLPNSVTEIGSQAFVDCVNLSEINYPMSLERGGDGIFENVPLLNKITVPEGVETLAENAFSANPYLTEISLPSTLTMIGRGAFSYCTGLTEIDIPSSVTTIGSYAFEGCSGITEFKLPKDLITMGTAVFARCSSLAKINIPSMLSNVGTEIFEEDPALTTVIFDEGRTFIPAHLFSDAEHLKQITLPDTVTLIEENAFSGCTGITSLSLPAGLTKIERDAFSGCTGLRSIEIPENVKELGSFAFSWCTGLRKVTLPNGLTKIGQEAFGGCSSLAEINYPISLEEAYLIFKETPSLQKITVPEGVTTIPENALASSSGLRRVTLPSTLRSIERNAFAQCSNLEKLVLPDAFTTIGEYAFENCTSMTAIWIGDKVTEIPDTAFNEISTDVLTIHGIAGSYAEQFAAQNGYPFSTERIADVFVGIGGKALDRNIKPMENVCVTIFDCEDLKTVATIYTDSDGLWNFAEAAEGRTYRIYFSRENMYFEKPAVTVIAQENAEAETALGQWVDFHEIIDDGECFEYEIINGAEIRITKFKGNTAQGMTVHVPESIDGYLVTEIGNSAFEKMDNISDVILPSSVKKIGAHAFYGSELLEVAALGSGVTEISQYAFENCPNLKTVAFSGCLESIGQYAFDECASLQDIVLPETVKNMGGHAFSGCPSLADVNYPMLFEHGGSGIFENDPLMNQMTVPEGVKVLADYAFAGWTALTEVSLPSTLAVIGSGAFSGCTSLGEIALPESLTEIRSFAFEGCSAITTMELPNSVEKIGQNAFNSCTSLSAINYPLSLSDAYRIFENTPSLNSFTVPEGVTSIPANVFGGAESLREILLPSTLAEIGDSSFADCSSLVDIDLPDALTAIGSSAFSDCQGLTEITIPGNVTEIRSFAFSNCRGLKKVTLPDGLTKIGQEAFRDCANLAEINYPVSLSEAYRIFENCTSLRTITVPEGVSVIPDNVFADASGLRRVNLPATLTAIGSNSFSECMSINKMILPDSITAIGDEAFYNCTALNAIWIGENVTTIHDSAFTGCSTSVLVIHGVEGSYAQQFANEHGFAFSTDPVEFADAALSGRCVDENGKGIENAAITIYDVSLLTVASEVKTDANGYWSYTEAEQDGKYRIRLYDKYHVFENPCAEITAGTGEEITALGRRIAENGTETAAEQFAWKAMNGSEAEITGYTGSGTLVVIPETIGGLAVRKIGWYAFSKNNSIKCVILPDSCTTLDQGAFSECANLETVLMGQNTSKIGYMAFAKCSALKNIAFGGKTEKIGQYAFEDCTALETVILPDTVKSVSNDAFSNCPLLSSVNYPMSLENGFGSSFENDPLMTKMDVPEGVRKLADDAFSGWEQLEEVTLPSTLQIIGRSAFSNCISITDIMIPESVTEIQAFAFESCNGLSKVTLPDGVAKIGQNAFSDCTALTEINYPMSLSEAYKIFEGTTSLTAFEVPEGVTVLPDNLFGGAPALSDISLPSTLTEIGRGTFEGCTALTEIELPESLVKIGESAFSGCTALKGIEVPQNVTEIGAYAFSVSGVETVSLPDGLTKIGQGAFESCEKLTTINYPISLTDAYHIFDEKTAVRKITIPEGVTALPENVFGGASNLRYVDLPSTLTVIGNGAFSGCKGLPYIDIPYSVTFIGTESFSACEGLVEINIPGNVHYIDQWSFCYCTNLESVTIEDGTVSIGQYAFLGNTELKEVWIPASVTNIGYKAFEECGDFTIYTPHNSYAGLYAIDNNIKVVFTGEYTETDGVVLDRENSTYTLSADRAAYKGYVEGVVQYVIREEVYPELEDISVKIRVPHNMIADLRSITLDGIVTDYRFEDENIIVPVKNRTGQIRFALTPKVDESYYTYAQMICTKDSEVISELIDTVSATIPELTLNAQSVTASEKITVSGVARAESEVRLFIDGSEAAVVKAGKNGSYSAALTIPEPVDGMYYILKAETSGQNDIAVSAETEIVYYENEPTVTQFDMYYDNHEQARINLLNQSMQSSVVSWNPSVPLTFVVGFENADKVENVKICSTKKGERKYIDAKYDSISGKYVASGFFGGNSSYTPGQVSVVYESKTADSGFDINNESQGDVYLKNAEKLYGGDRNPFKVVGSAIDTAHDINKFFFELNPNSKNPRVIKPFAENKEFVFTSQVLYASKENKTVKQIIDAYKLYDHYFDVDSDNYCLTVIKNYIENPGSVSATSGILMLIGNTLDNSVTRIFIECPDSEAFLHSIGNAGTAADFYQGMSALGKLAKGFGKLYGGYAFTESIRASILKSKTMSDYEQRKALEELEQYEKVNAVGQIISMFWGIGVIAAPLPAKIVFYLADGIFQDYMSHWKEAIKAGNYDYNVLMYLEDKFREFLAAFGLEWLIDPSGNVYAGYIGNPLTGAIVTVYYRDDSGGWIPWNAEDYFQQNPIITGKEGAFSWDVPEGKWKILVECSGYSDLWSEEYDVPPEVTGIEMNMMAEGAVEVAAVYQREGYIEIAFTQPVYTDALKDIAITDKNGGDISGTISTPEAGCDTEGKKLAKYCYIYYEESGEDAVLVKLPDTIESYNGTKTTAENISLENAAAPEISFENEAVLRSGDVIALKGHISDYTGKEELLSETGIYAIASVKALTGPDEDGNFTLWLKGVNAGETSLSVGIRNTSVTVSVPVTVGTEVNESDLAKNVPHEHIFEPVGDGEKEECVICGAENETKPVRVTGITLQSEDGSVSGTDINIELPATKTHALQAVIEPENAAVKNVKWESSNTKAAVVDENGVVTGKTVGKTIITATTEDGEFTANCEVNVLFSDVTNKKLANFNAIYSLVEKGVIAGFKSGEYFAPDDQCTRAQVVLFMWRAAGRPTPKSTKLTFKDAADIEKLAPDYKKAILWGNEKGIVMGFTSGVNKGKFLPNTACTRAQIVLFLYRFAGQPKVKNTTLSFKDAATIRSMAPAYTNAILWAVEKKITTGYGDKTFRPNQTCTRGECATFLYRAVK